MKNIPILLILLSFVACQPEAERADAYGNFEADPTIIGAEANGRLLYLNVEEGEPLAAGRLVGLIDTTQLHLQKLQIKATIAALAAKTRSPLPEIEVLREQTRSLEREKARVEALLADKAATPKQLDDIQAQIDVVAKQIESARQRVNDANRGILSEADPLYAQLAVLDEQMRKCYIYNPIGGTVLTKMAKGNEMAHFGTALYRIASLDTVTLRAYFSGNQLSNIQLGQEVEVLIDQPGEAPMRSYRGTIEWIASEAEFTPKTIQTREERVNLVYAAKVDVPNTDGMLKIGMPGEVWLASKPIVSSHE
ncbi:HlyD family secretion protein [Flavilitoribacter nigricans]|uniref:HlyD family secretion protein n=1 Tax=Flavilitoribacter nigricans (strain ATCC 23147 / DSM 23189 / NBRC 102662 / NCIMB 1420 / SS-2) TaxID=1122177 RepID=A0A2D0N4X4_FLAN2|nr:efflux RND transporter periplasmic adaptor subunit [Flavilitoribacter nigricans]PHN03209.1 HlyD family secretion protein [Flavilitoribacter nigricans DSM 23189 = NBRC 102662]